eukprot:TRINITY_DN29698_c0_g1_i1.p1 TRINITY_DN29698_c0_g1~~TRINITY_DN29698_c0_g1_i1.p1  ORF type:complete len:489 (+),score=155.46 TRINITY_DN29698_c0_g1_i1:45-1511(+)
MGGVRQHAVRIQRCWRGHRVRRQLLLEAARVKRVETAALQDEEFDCIWGFEPECPEDVVVEEADGRDGLTWIEREAFAAIRDARDRSCLEVQEGAVFRISLEDPEAVLYASLVMLCEAGAARHHLLTDASTALLAILDVEAIQRTAIAACAVRKVPTAETAARERISEAQDIARSLLFQQKTVDATTIIMEAMRVPFRLTPVPAVTSLQEDEEYARYKIRSEETCCLTELYFEWMEGLNAITTDFVTTYPVAEASARRVIESEEASLRVEFEEGRHLAWLRMTYSEAQVEILRNQISEEEYEDRDTILSDAELDFMDIQRLFSRRLVQMRTWYVEQEEEAARDAIGGAMHANFQAICDDCTRLARDDQLRRTRAQEEKERALQLEMLMVCIWDEVAATALGETRGRCAVENGQSLAFQNLLQVIRLHAGQHGIHVPSVHHPLVDPVNHISTRVEVAKRASKLPPTPAGGARSAVKQLAADKGSRTAHV